MGSDWKNYSFYVGGSYGAGDAEKKGDCVYVPSSGGDISIDYNDWVNINNRDTNYRTVDEAYNQIGHQNYYIEFDGAKTIGGAWDGLHLPSKTSDYGGVPTGTVWDSNQRIRAAAKDFAFDQNYATIFYKAQCSHVKSVASHELSNEYLMLAKIVDVNLSEGSVTIGFCAGARDGTTQTCVMVAKFKADALGNISINKAPKVPEIVEGNSNYSLAGAQYGVYTDKACTKRAKDAYGNDSGIVTDDKGYGEAQNLPVGTYYIKELVPSPNYQLDTKVYTVATQAGQTVSAGLSSEPANYGYIDLIKRSANESITSGNSCYSLEGAVYGIYRDSTCKTKVMEITTNKDGFATTKGAKEGNTLIEDRITLDNYWIKEITAPKGFALDTTVYTVSFAYGDGNGKHRYVNEKGEGIQPVEWQTKEKGVVYDMPQSDPIGLLLGKLDSETSQSSPLAGATLKGAEFNVTYYDIEGQEDKDSVYLSEAAQLESKAKVIKNWVFSTDEIGRILLKDDYKITGEELYRNSTGIACLPIGTVVIEEINPPQGYLNSNEGKCWIRTITSSGAKESVFTYNPPDGETAFKEQVIRGDLAFTKANAQTQQRLAGVPFVIKSKTTGEWHVAV